MKRCLLLIALAVIFPSYSVSAQEKMSVGALNDAEKRIMSENSSISKEVLGKDREAIQEIHPKIVKKYKEKLTKEEIQESLFWHWKKLRTGSDAIDDKVGIDEETFEKMMLAQGVLRIKSEPSEAKVYIDGRLFNRRTTTTVLISLGKHKVKATKGDAKAEEEDCEVKEDEVAEVTLKLK
jgi:hypothetical protein